jgi:hypothetical protein
VSEKVPGLFLLKTAVSKNKRDTFDHSN